MDIKDFKAGSYRKGYEYRYFLPEKINHSLFSGFCAYLSFKLSCKLRDEMKSDERLIVSKIIHPGLAVHDHDKCVVKCNILRRQMQYFQQIQEEGLCKQSPSI
ncbi:MAG: hypothetical protein JRE64_27095 [Deltaproteobacteria bacterium]|nr:hypothetical protein [Deltaproteobacteria bacterium]